MSVNSVRQPTYMRYARVEMLMQQEAAFVQLMGAKTEIVLKPNGDEQYFSPEVIAVTQAIHDAGKDAHKVPKLDVLRAAMGVLKVGKNSGNGHVPAAPKTEAPAPAKASNKKAKKGAKTSPKSKPQPEIERDPSEAKTRENVVAAPVTPVPVTPVPSTPVPVTPVPVSEPEKLKETAISNTCPGENPAAYNPFISMYSLVITSLQLCELFDKQPGNERRRKILDDLAVELNRYTSIKSAASAKETQKA